MGRFFVLLALLPCAAQAQPADIAQAIRTADWPTAEAIAAGAPDPVAQKLVTFYRLQHPGDAKATEIAAFIADNPDWPAQPVLVKRRDEALANETDDAAVRPLCTATPAVAAPRSGPALTRCAEAQAAAGQREDAAASARTAWVAGLPDADSEARFLQRWQGLLTPADELQRFRALLAAAPSAAAPSAAAPSAAAPSAAAPSAAIEAQVARLAPGDQALARARLAVRARDLRAASLIAALPPSRRADPDLVLDEARALRRADQDEAALALWTSTGFTAEREAGAPRAEAFWAERSLLARRRLQAGDNQGAFALADDGLQTSPEPQADAAFLGGFIALRRLNAPALAQTRFALLAHSTAAISQARAHYWLGRAATALREADTARREYAAAAAWPTTYYGQLAALALGDDTATLQARINALADPPWTTAQALDFAGRELARAAAILVAWGDPARARPFLQQLTVLAADPATRSMAAHLALGLDLPDQAVAVARRAGRDGTLLPQAGWPLPVSPPDQPVPAAVSLGIIRQESSFDTGAVSPSGARGLMQLMPATANEVGRQIAAPVTTASLTTDPNGNMRLGSAYFGQLLDRFGGALPLAIAAYNAGPNRVQQWLADNGDPRGAGGTAMIDWVELIGFAETRNYVQRVIENITVYRARRHETAPYPVGA